MKTIPSVDGRLILSVSIMMAALCFAGSARATDYTWVGGGADNNWSTASNWQDPQMMHHVPTAADNATIGNFSVNLDTGRRDQGFDIERRKYRRGGRPHGDWRVYLESRVDGRLGKNFLAGHEHDHSAEQRKS
jgi:hypothetical protein